MPEEAPSARANLVQKLWTTLEKLNIAFDINHYNALLKTHLDNNYSIKPEKIIAEIKQNGLVPTR